MFPVQYNCERPVIDDSAIQSRAHRRHLAWVDPRLGGSLGDVIGGKAAGATTMLNDVLKLIQFLERFFSVARNRNRWLIGVFGSLCILSVVGQLEFSKAGFRSTLSNLNLTMLWNLVAIGLLLYSIPAWPKFLERTTELKAGGVSLKLEVENAKNSRGRINLTSNSFAIQRRWGQVADMVCLMRESHSTEDRIVGLMASADLIVQLYDTGETLRKRRASTPDKAAYPDFALRFCDEALECDWSLPDKQRMTPAIYYWRAIVLSRIAELNGDEDVARRGGCR